MTIGSRKGMLTKNVNTLKGTMESYKTSISELFDWIRDKESINDTSFVTLGKEQLPMPIEGSALFHSLIAMFNDGAKNTVKDSERVRKAMDSLKAECTIHSKEAPSEFPDDIGQAIETAEKALKFADVQISSWRTYAEKVSQALATRNQANDAHHVVNHNVNQEGSRSAPASPLELILQKLDGLDSRMTKLEEMSISRTQSLVDNNSVGDDQYEDSFMNSTFIDELDSARNRSQFDLFHHSQVQILPANRQPHNTARAEQMMKQHVNSQPHVDVDRQPQAKTNSMYNQSLLPPLKAQAFSGKRTMYEEFKAVFEITIGDNTYIQDRQKLLYLKGLLPNQDKATVSRYPLSDRGYRLAWQYLEKKYGNTNDVAEELLSQLKSLTVVNDSLQANKDMWLEAQSIVAQWELLEPLQPRLVNDIILRHFSPDVCREIYLAFSENTTNSWTEFQELTDRIIMKRETAERRDVIYSRKTHRMPQNTSSPIHVQPKQKTFKCIYCEALDHYPSDCTMVPLHKRKEFLKSNGRCENCAGKGHSIEQCASTIACPKCWGKHHRSLACSSKQSNPQHQNKYLATQKVQKGYGSHNPQGAAKMNIIQMKAPRADCTRESPPVHHTLPIILVKLKGKSDPVPVFLDCGAQVSLIDSTLAKELNLETGTATTLRMQGFHTGGTIKLVSNIVQMIIEGPNSFSLPVQMYSVDNPIGDTEVSILSDADREFMKKKKLRPPRSGMSGHIKPAILLGVDVLWKILQGLKTFDLPSGNVLLMTKLGSLVTGPHGLNDISNSESGRVKVVRQCQLWINHHSDSQPLCTSHNDEAYMVTEDLKPDHLEKKETNQKVLKRFNKSIEKRANGYFVNLPTKENIQELKDNYWVAMTRLRQFVGFTKSRQSDVFKEYAEAIQLLVERKFIEEVPADPQKEPVEISHTATRFYLPHQAIKAAGKSLRIVFDGSSHARNESSLNDMLHVGPLLLRPLLSILWSTRFNRYMISADVEKAFLQVHLKEESRDLVRFLWLRDPFAGYSEANVMSYRFTRVPFGLSCSPFLLNATVLFHLSKLSSPIAERVLHCMYVDNLILTVDSKDEIQELCQEIKNMFNDLHMNMRSFLVNDKTEFDHFSENDKGKWDIQKFSVSIMTRNQMNTFIA